MVNGGGRTAPLVSWTTMRREPSALESRSLEAIAGGVRAFHRRWPLRDQLPHTVTTKPVVELPLGAGVKTTVPTRFAGN